MASFEIDRLALASSAQTLDFFRRLERFAFAMMLVVTDRKQRLKRYGRIADLARVRGP